MPQKLKQDIAIGPTIRRLRTEAGLTQEQVVSKLQLKGLSTSRSIYSQIEVGTYNIRISELTALKEIFGVSYADFFADLP
ncbi:MAG: helix-turn-helix transcriptional regulator [Clostridia bacterium]|nr:helix-turn-helix transcriptional regulator [Clostridia bacterium]MBQ7113311.1 helix-turn-helix transcriptional regulator [Clostridia bacterium]